MCDISIKVNKKKVTIYKWVSKKGGLYISPVFEAIIKKGSTKNIKIGDYYHLPGNYLYNDLMRKNSLVSGFATIKGAMNVRFMMADCLLKIVLSGDIYQGTAKGLTIFPSNPLRIKTYAGNYIESIKEIDYKY